GYSYVSLGVIDEASRVPDDLYRAVRPMLAVSNGRLIYPSTPYGKRGFFHDAWARGGDDRARIAVPADRIPRISAASLAQERRPDVFPNPAPASDRIREIGVASRPPPVAPDGPATGAENHCHRYGGVLGDTADVARKGPVEPGRRSPPEPEPGL